MQVVLYGGMQMNKEELKLTEYLHSIIEENISLRRNNDKLWKDKLEYIGRINKAIEYVNNHIHQETFTGYMDSYELKKLLSLLKGDKE